MSGLFGSLGHREPLRVLHKRVEPDGASNGRQPARRVAMRIGWWQAPVAEIPRNICITP
jgi:hypothetical protein